MKPLLAVVGLMVVMILALFGTADAVVSVLDVPGSDAPETPQATPVPGSLPRQPITIANAADIKQVWRIGRGEILALASSDEIVAVGSPLGLWLYNPDDLATRPRVIISSRQGAKHIAFSSDGTRIAAAGDTMVQIWDVAAGNEEIAYESAVESILSIAFSPDSLRLAIAGKQRSIEILDTTTGQLLTRLEGHGNGYIRGLRFNPKTGVLASASDDQSIRLWDVETGETLSILSDQGAPVRSLAFDRSGTLLVAGTNIGEIHVWNMETGDYLGHISTGYSYLNAIEFITGDMLAVSGPGGSIGLWQITIDQEADLSATRIDGEWNDDNRTLIAANPSGTLWAMANSHLLSVWQIQPLAERAVSGGYSLPIQAAAVSPVADHIAFSYRNSRLIQVWAFSADGSLARQPSYEMETGAVLCLAFSPDGRLLAAGSQASQITIWDTESGDVVAVSEGNIGAITSVSFSASGDRLAVGSESGDIMLWDTTTAQPLSRLEGHSAAITQIKFSPSAETLLVSGDVKGITRVWDTVTLRSEIIMIKPGHPVTDLAFNPAGSRLAASHEDDVTLLWTVHDHNFIPSQSFNAPTGQTVDRILFGSQGDLLILGDRDGNLAFWDVDGMKELARFRIHAAGISALALDPAGTIVITGSEDGVIKLFGT